MKCESQEQYEYEMAMKQEQDRQEYLAYCEEQFAQEQAIESIKE